MAYKDREVEKAYQKAYRKANKERLASYRKAYRKANKERLAAQNKAYQEANKEEIRQRQKEYQRSYRPLNREKRNSHNANRRARKLNQTPDLNKAEKVEIESMYLYNGIFNAVMPEKEWHVDHIVALANGGLHHPSNLQVLTKHDNLSKGARE